MICTTAEELTANEVSARRFSASASLLSSTVATTAQPRLSAEITEDNVAACTHDQHGFGELCGYAGTAHELPLREVR